jgi:hypothetical protein
MYIDDFVWFGPRDFLVSEMSAFTSQVAADIHPEAINREKSSMSSCETVLGIRTDSLNYRCGISLKSFLKLCYLFFIVIPPSLSSSTMLSLHTVQSMSSLCYHNGQYIPLVRFTGSVFFRALCGYSTRARPLNHLQIECVKLWRSYLLFAFSHPSVLASSMYDVYHNNPNTYPISRRAISSPVGYSDSSLLSMGAFVPQLGYCQVHLVDIFSPDVLDSFTIAHYELLAFIIAFLLALFLNSDCRTAIHIFVDNQNALAWSQGRIKTSDNLANILTMSNCFLQVGYNICQTRSYIRSQDNVQADQISRQQFANSDNLTQFSPSPRLIQFFRELVSQRDPDVSRILQLSHTLRDTTDSSLFVSC